MRAANFLPDRQFLAASNQLSGEVAQAWSASPGYRRLAKAFSGADNEPAEALAARAQSLFAEPGWISALLDPLVEALRGDPWFEPPFRVNRDAGRIGAVLFESPALRLSASVVAPMARHAAVPPGASVVVPGRLSVIYCHRTGGARWAQFAAGPAEDDFSARTARACVPVGETVLEAGGVYRHDGRVAGQLTLGGSGAVVLVTAMMFGQAARYTREYSIATGALARVSALDDGGSRAQMLLAFLACTARAEAPEILADISRDRAFFVRWSAMQHWLTVDARGAMPRLREMAAADDHADVRGAAAAMVPVVETHLSCLA